MAFCGGHKEIAVGIDRPIVIGTMLGEVEKDRLITTAGARPGDDILLSKAMRHGRIHSMHDPTEGGLANALHEIAAAANVGLVVEEDRVPILEECKVLCNHYGLDPLGLIASGSLLIMVESSDSGKVIRSLGKAGIPAAKIGEIAHKEQGVKIRCEQRLKDVPMFARDEIARILEKA